MSQPQSALLEVEGLQVSFPSASGSVDAVRDVAFRLKPGEILGLVGESGCGKSLTALALLGLTGAVARVAGRARYQGRELIGTSAREMERLRGCELAMIFQDPVTSLNPVMPVGTQIAEALRLSSPSGGRRSRADLKTRCIELLREVEIPDPVQRLRAYPHELSGGLCQRVMIAMMLAREPALLIADEPTTALDVTVQAQILALLKRLRDERGTAIILITHDLGVVAQTCDRVAVMYCGEIVEEAPVEALFSMPRHPYTRGLIAARASIGDRDRPLASIPGVVPPPGARPVGCAFVPRCPRARELCEHQAPPRLGGAHLVACHAPIPQMPAHV